MEEKSDQLLCNNIVRENDVSIYTFIFLRFIFASIYYHYENLDRNLHEKNVLRVSSIFIAAARAGEFRKYAVVSLPWTKTDFTPFFTGIPPHAMIMAEIEILKKKIAKKTCAIVYGLKKELDKRNMGGDTYQATMVLEEVKRAHEMMYTELRSITSNVNGRVMYNNPAFKHFSNRRKEDLGKLNYEGRYEIIQ